MNFNINNYIEVVLTEHGASIYNKRFRGLLNLHYFVCPDVKPGHVLQIQLWDFMSLFGEHLGMAKPNVIEDCNMKFDMKDFEAIK